jgi:hypothetical protein
MRGWFRIQSANWLTGGAHLGIIGIAGQADSPAVWPYALGAIALVSFAAWVGNYRRLRQIADTPPSKIASAAQGYVELSGRAEEPGGTPILSKLTGLECVWYHYEIYEKGPKNEWSLKESDDSDDPFVIRDATGQCIIDPEGAEVVTSRKKTWTEGDNRYTEWLVLPRDQVYALGEFVTISGADGDLDLNGDVSAMLAEWKKDQPDLLRRFDLDNSGTLDLKEWDLARRQARREVEAQHRELRMRGGTNVLRKPADGKLFLVSNYLPDKLRNIYLLWSWVHTGIFVAAGGFAVALF